jgi:hypothetical protein
MAEAVSHMSSVQKTVTVQEKVYTLSLSEQEVSTLVAIFSRIGGSPALSARGNVSRIIEALNKAGAPHYTNVKEHDYISGSITFYDYSEGA